MKLKVSLTVLLLLIMGTGLFAQIHDITAGFYTGLVLHMGDEDKDPTLRLMDMETGHTGFAGISGNFVNVTQLAGLKFESSPSTITEVKEPSRQFLICSVSSLTVK